MIYGSYYNVIMLPWQLAFVRFFCYQTARKYKLRLTEVCCLYRFVYFFCDRGLLYNSFPPVALIFLRPLLLHASELLLLS